MKNLQIDEVDVGAYHESVERQGRDWIDGVSKHNIRFDECCPDFSCCVPHLFMQNRLKRIVIYNCWAKHHDRPIYTDN